MQTSIHGNNFASRTENDSLGEERSISPLVIPPDCEPSYEAFDIVVDDFVNDVILDFCFQVHPATKVGLIKAADNVTVLNETEDIFGQVKGKVKLSKVDCPYCNRKTEATRFANHLEKCDMGTGRQRGRNASKKINFEACQDSDFDDDDDDENEVDVSYNSSGKKRPKKKTMKNNSRKKVNRDLSFENAGNSQQPFDVKLFLDQYCGVKSKHTKKMCMKSLKCSQHTVEQRKAIRTQLIPNFINQSQPKPEDVQIDVDTVDEEISGGYTSQNVSGYSTPEIFNGYFE